MSDDTDGTLTDPKDVPPAGNPDETPDDNGDGQAPDPRTAENRKLARESQGLRKRIREFEAEKAARDDAELTEAEKSANRIKELEKALEAKDERVRETALRSEVMSAASRLGIAGPDDAYRLIDRTGLEYDDDTARWSGVDDALGSLVKDRPWLMSQAPTPGASANPSNPSRRRSALTIADLKKMSDAEIYAMPIEELHAIQSAGQ